LDSYLDALQHFPDHVEVLHTTKGNANLIKKDIFKNLMWYTLPDSNKQYPLTIETVKKIKAMNEKGQRPEELEIAEIVSASGKVKEAEPQFVELVGQISLRSLDRNAQKRKGQRSGPGPRDSRQAPAGNQGPRERGQSSNANQGPRERPKMQDKAPGAQGPRPQGQPGGRPQRERPQGQARPQASREKAAPQDPAAPRTKPSIQINKEK
jgi:hypothetical protein